MPKKCGNCGGTISSNEEADHCYHCNLPYHEDCKPDICVQCNKR
jgi:hypothetical protein